MNGDEIRGSLLKINNTRFGSRLFAKSEGGEKWQTSIFIIEEDESSRRKFCLTTLTADYSRGQKEGKSDRRPFL